MTSSIILTHLGTFYNCYTHYISLNTFSTTCISLQISITINFTLSLRTFGTHIAPNDNIRYVNSFFRALAIINILSLLVRFKTFLFCQIVIKDFAVFKSSKNVSQKQMCLLPIKHKIDT